MWKWFCPLFLWGGVAIAGSASLSWTPPTQNTDGSPLIDLADYKIYWGCNSDIGYPNSVFTGLVTNYIIQSLPDQGTCRFVATAINISTNESVFSNEAIKSMGANEVPGKPSIDISWEESKGSGLMPAIHDATVNAHTEGATLITVGLTITSGAQLLIVMVFVDHNADDNPVASSDIDGALTALTGGEVIASGNSQACAIFYLQNPTVGAHVITGDWDTSTIGAVVAFTVDSINTTTPITDAATNSGNVSSVSSTVANAASGDLIIDAVAINSNPVITAGANQTESENNSTGTSGGTMYGMSTQAGADGGVMSWSWTGAQRTAQVAFRLPAAGGGAGLRRKGSLLLAGVGR